MSHEISDSVIAALVATGKWAEQTARVAARADYRCEYCGLDTLSSPEAYKLFEVDHIIPLSAGGSREDMENLALACRHCNVHYKSRWNPRSVVADGATRQMLVDAVKQRIAEVRSRVTNEVRVMREIVGRDVRS